MKVTETELKRVFRRAMRLAMPLPALLTSACSDTPQPPCNGRCIHDYDASASGGSSGTGGTAGTGGLSDPCATAGAGGCASYCATTGIGAGAGGNASLDCASLCNGAVATCEYVADYRVKCHPECARQRSSARAIVGASASQVARYFMEMAGLEAGSVPAFRKLRRELASFGAPLGLRRAAHRAALDEVRHARIARHLARRFGGEVHRPASTEPACETLEQMATENAVAGCVGETFGALIATWQARRASDRAVRRALRQIARDEVRHAALSWRIARWAESRLDAEANARVSAARHAAAEALVARQNYASAPALETLAGVPHSARAHAMARALSERLWA